MADYHPENEMVWIGDLSGFQVEEVNDISVMLTHRCGFALILYDSDKYLGNIILKALEHRKETCVPYRT
jgi:hypothetical protein